MNLALNPLSVRTLMQRMCYILVGYCSISHVPFKLEGMGESSDELQGHIDMPSKDVKIVRKILLLLYCDLNSYKNG